MGIQHVVYRLGLKYQGGLRQLAADMGRNYNVFINKLNPNVATHHVYIEELDELAAFLDTDEVAKYFAGQRNMICVPCPDLNGLSDAALLDLFFGLETEKAQWMERMQTALSDGNVTGAEFAAIKREYDEFVAATSEVMARIELYMQASEEREARLSSVPIKRNVIGK